MVKAKAGKKTGLTVKADLPALKSPRGGAPSYHNDGGRERFHFALLRMLEEEGDSVLRWHYGTLHIVDPLALQRDVLPRFMRTDRYESFLRQLHLYRFRKVEGKGRWNPAAYSHPDLAAYNDPRIILSLRPRSSFAGNAKAGAGGAGGAGEKGSRIVERRRSSIHDTPAVRAAIAAARAAAEEPAPGAGRKEKRPRQQQQQQLEKGAADAGGSGSGAGGGSAGRKSRMGDDDDDYEEDEPFSPRSKVPRRDGAAAGPSSRRKRANLPSPPTRALRRRRQNWDADGDAEAEVEEDDADSDASTVDAEPPWTTPRRCFRVVPRYPKDDDESGVDGGEGYDSSEPGDAGSYGEEESGGGGGSEHIAGAGYSEAMDMDDSEGEGRIIAAAQRRYRTAESGGCYSYGTERSDANDGGRHSDSSWSSGTSRASGASGASAVSGSSGASSRCGSGGGGGSSSGGGGSSGRSGTVRVDGDNTASYGGPRRNFRVIHGPSLQQQPQQKQAHDPCRRGAAVAEVASCGYPDADGATDGTTDNDDDDMEEEALPLVAAMLRMLRNGGLPSPAASTASTEDGVRSVSWADAAPHHYGGFNGSGCGGNGHLSSYSSPGGWRSSNGDRDCDNGH